MTLQLEPDRYFLGLDLGQAQDFSALVALRREELERPPYSRRRLFRFEVRGVRRWALRTPYSEIAADVAALVEEAPLAGCTLGVDGTGVGAAVLELIAEAKPNATIRPVLITAGHAVTLEGGVYHVAKI
jgi:hypothetical protein